MKKFVLLLQGFTFLTSLSFAELPTNKEDLLKTTLTELNKINPTTYPNSSAYQLEETTDTSGTFVISKYWNDNNSISKLDYNVKFNDVLGDATGTRTFRYNWIITEDGTRTLDKALSSSCDITAKVNSANNARVETTQQGENIAHSFIGLSTSNTSYVYGGAVYNSNISMGNIDGDFIANNLASLSSSQGGAIYSTGKINTITSNFIGNYTKGLYADGGAIYNSGTITSIIGDFIGNYVYFKGIEPANPDVYGGAIYNSYDAIIKSITGDFIGNYSYADVGSYLATTHGGAICNSGTIEKINGNFISNYTRSNDSAGGAIYNQNKITSINGNFIENHATESGGAIYNSGIITSISGDFIGNYISGSSGSYLDGGAIHNSGTIKIITGNFIKNYSNFIDDSYEDLHNSLAKSAYLNGGAIFNSGTIEMIKGNFIENGAYVSRDYVYHLRDYPYYSRGGAIYNERNAEIKTIIGNFIGNHSAPFDNSEYAKGGAIFNIGTIESITGEFIGNYSSYNITVTDFTPLSQGGAIYNSDGGSITIREGSSFTGNYVSTDGGTTKTFEAIYNASSMLAVINFNAYDSSKSIIVNDGINGDDSYENRKAQVLNINQTSDNVSYGTVEFNSFVKNQTVNVLNGTLKLGSFAGATLDVNGTKLIVPEAKASLTNSNVNVSGGAKVVLDTQVAINASEIYLEDGATLSITKGARADILTDSTLILDYNSTLQIDTDGSTSISIDSNGGIEIIEGSKISINFVGDSITNDASITVMEWQNDSRLTGLENLVQNSSIFFNVNGKTYSGYWRFITINNQLVISTAIPEPAEWATIFGAIALGLAMYRRKK